MKTKKRIIRIFDIIIIMTGSLFAAIALSSCFNDKDTITYMVNEPVYMSFSDFRTPPPVKAAQEIASPGKICLYGDYIFINEVNKGFHVIDNTNPSSPQRVAFIDLPGNIDLAVKDNLLFADNYVDLVWFDISQPAQPMLAGRLEQAFPEALPPAGNNYPMTFIDHSKGVVVDWKVKTIIEERPRNLYMEDAAFVSNGSNGGAGVATMTGSMARFAVYDNHLYVVTNFMLKVFALSGNTVTKGDEQYLNWNTETIFAYNQKLFLGTTSGLLIYDIADPAMPERLS
jgi:hypothetical protein